MNSIAGLLGVELPLVAFSHCRDVVAAVTNAGGFGVLGASSGRSPEELDIELGWIDREVRGRPYGVDIVCPAAPTGDDPDLDRDALAKQIPERHRAFVHEVLREGGIDMALEPDDLGPPMRVDRRYGEQLLDVSFSHPIGLIANALGIPPAAMLARAHAAGVPVAALVGTTAQATRQAAAGVDVIVAQGTEAGGHTGSVTTMVLVPEVVAAVRDVPVLAAGGIVTGAQMAAAIALGAAGVWTGSVWLTSEEADTAPTAVARMLAATSSDTVRSRGRTGKPSRQLRSRWTDAWEAEGSPSPLPMPLQSMLSEPALRRIDAMADRGDRAAAEFVTYWVGQGVGQMNSVLPACEIVRRMAEDFVDAAQRLRGFVE